MSTDTNHNDLIQISPDMKVEEALKRWPETIPVFIKYRMGCVGCSMAGFESLSGAARIYQLPVQGFLAELRQAIQK
jgi:hybrid cluster-associated redox disulfide protein